MRGLNDFSYADIAAELRITKPALHYHFASKADPGEALITRHAERFAEALEQVQAGFGHRGREAGRLRRPYLSVLRDRKMCLRV
jgi:TetR/AcrR family transcriptional regulator, transcriptional repressor for nem operon